MLILFLIVSLVLLGYISIKNIRVQTYITQKLAASYSKKINHSITLEQVRISFINRVSIKNLLIKDTKHDTLIYVPKLVANLRKFNKQERLLQLSKLKLDDGIIKFTEDSLNQLSISTFINSVKVNRDTTKEKMKIEISSFKISDAKFTLKKNNFFEKPGLNMSDLNMDNFNMKVEDFTVSNETINLNMTSFNGIDKSGFSIMDFKSIITISSSGMKYSHGVLSTNTGSDVQYDSVILSYTSYQDLSKEHFVNKVRMDIHLNPSQLSYYDLHQFVNKITPHKDGIKCSGRIYGTMSSLRLRGLSVTIAQKTTFKGSVDLNGLPDIKSTFIFADIDNFATTISDIQSLVLPERMQKINLPEAVYKSGQYKYKGKFTGFIDDFVSYGIVFTDLGIISTDLAIKPDTGKYVGFKGKVKAHNFDIGKLTGQEEKIGKISLMADITGSSSSEQKIYADLNGRIIQIEVNKYSYRNIILNGKLSDKFFIGSVNIKDPNLVFDFDGGFDFSNTLPLFDFRAELHHADLYKLHFVSSDSVFKTGFLVTANFTGRNIDELEGKISLVDSYFEKSDQKFELSNLTLLAQKENGSKTLHLSSSVMNGKLTGNYDFITLVSALQDLTNEYIPSLGKSSLTPADTGQNDFSYYFECGNTKELCDFFIPGFCISKGSSFFGFFCPSDNNFTLTCNSSELVLANKPFTNFQLSLVTYDSLFSIHAGCESLKIAENLTLDNFTFLSEAMDDNISITARWINWDSLINKGNLMANMEFSPSIISNRPKVDLDILRSDITYGKTTWQIHEGAITYDSSLITIDQVKLTNNNRAFICYGKLSNDPEDKLKIDIQNFNLSSLNLFTSSKGLVLDGSLNGQAIVSQVFTDPIINSDFIIDSLFINSEPLGKTLLSSYWNNREKSLNIEANVKRGKINTLEVDGLYFPQTRRMAFNLHLEKLRLNILEPFVEKNISDIKGIASGNLALTGSATKPVMNGELLLQKSSFKVNYLQTKYYITDKVEINNNNFYLKKFKILDENGNKALIDGKVETDYLKNVRFSINMRIEDFHLLNTTEKDNSQFYGNAFATGPILMKGQPKNINIVVALKTNQNTVFYIPLSKGEDISENTFISWTDTKRDTLLIEAVKEYNVDLSGITMDFDLEVTPDAEAQIIFDSKVGDVIKSKGSGIIKLSINTLGKFRIYGDYVIEEGDYLFTLQNVINKRFKVESGSTIRWNGEPDDADIDIKAIYKLKASLSNLTLYSTPQDNLSRRLPVECQLFLTNRLLNPNIKLNIDAPTADESTRNIIKSATSTEEDMSKQFLSLLVLNSFMSDREPMSQNGSSTQISQRSNVAGVTTSELLSNQLSHWLSQISNDFDIGVNYRPGDEITSDEVELALSTQLLNDRVSINGNLDMGGQQTDPTKNGTSEDKVKNTTANNIMGDFDVDVKITKSGKLRVKAFNRANDKLIYIDSPYTQGVGLFYREEFDNLGDLLSQYWKKFFKRKKSKS